MNTTEIAIVVGVAVGVIVFIKSLLKDAAAEASLKNIQLERLKTIETTRKELKRLKEENISDIKDYRKARDEYFNKYANRDDSPTKPNNSDGENT